MQGIPVVGIKSNSTRKKEWVHFYPGELRGCPISRAFCAREVGISVSPKTLITVRHRVKDWVFKVSEMKVKRPTSLKERETWGTQNRDGPTGSRSGLPPKRRGKWGTGVVFTL